MTSLPLKSLSRICRAIQGAIQSAWEKKHQFESFTPRYFTTLKAESVFLVSAILGFQVRGIPYTRGQMVCLFPMDFFARLPNSAKNTTWVMVICARIIRKPCRFMLPVAAIKTTLLLIWRIKITCPALRNTRRTRW